MLTSAKCLIISPTPLGTIACEIEKDTPPMKTTI